MEKTLKASFEIDISKALSSIKNITNSFKSMVAKLSGENVDKGKSLEFKNLTEESKKFTRSLQENVKSIRDLAKTKVNPNKIIPKNVKLKAPKMPSNQPKDIQANSGFGIVDAAVLAGLQKATAGIVDLGKNAVMTQAKISTVGNILHTVFGEATDDMNKFINASSNALGIGRQTAKEMATGYGIMLKDVGLSVGKTEKLTERLMEASSILAANTGHDMATVTDSIKSGLMGNTIAMDKLGIELKQASLQTTDAFKNIAKGRKFSELTFETQSLITAMAILEKTTKAYGGTIGDTANARLLSMNANLENAKNNMLEMMGEGLKPLTQLTANFAHYLAMITEALKALSPETKKILFIGTAVVAIIPIIVSSIALLIKGLTYLKTVVTGVGGIFGQFGKIISVKFLGAFVLITVGVAMLSEVFGGLANMVANIGKVINASLIYIAGSVLYTIGTIIGIFTGGSNAIKSIGQQMINSAGGIAKSVRASNKALSGAKNAANIQQKAMGGSTKANNKNAKSADKAAKAAKTLKDNLQSFDEINKITPDETGGAQDMDMGMPDMGGANLDGIIDSIKPAMKGLDNLKNKFQELKDRMQKILPIITAIGIAFLGLKFANLIKGLFTSGEGALGLLGAFKNLNLGTMNLVGGLKSIGTSLLGFMTNTIAILGPLAALGLTIYGITKYMNEGNMAMAAGVAGLGALALAVTVAIGAIMLGLAPVVGIIAGLVAGIGVLVGSWIGHNKKCEEVKKSLTDVEGANRALEEATRSLNEAVDSNINAIDRAEEAHRKLIDAEKANGISGEELQKQVDEGTLSYKSMNAQQREVYKAYRENKSAQEQVTKTTEQVKKATDEETKAQLNNKLTVLASKGSWDKYRDTLIDASNKGVISSDELKDRLEKACAGMDEAGRKTFVENLPKDIREGIDPNKYDTKTFGQHFQDVCNNIGNAFSNTFNKIRNWWNGLSFNKNVNVNANTGGSGGGRVPAMATGGVVSGATLALVGEGKYDEAVIPLGSSPQFTSMKEEIASAVISSLPQGGGNKEIQRIEVDILAGGKYMQKQIIDMTNGVEEYAW